VEAVPRASGSVSPEKVAAGGGNCSIQPEARHGRAGSVA
jgi:hypothetical protein